MTAKAFVKHVAGRLLFTTGMYRKCLGSRAIVALFHRVDDRYPDDPISCTREAFVNYCEFFRRYFEVVSLSQLLESLDRKENVAGKLVITFDDGYYDNEATAAEVLSKRGLPACFFVATAFIESKLTPWWDERAGIKSQFMSWNQVRALRANGFEVGAHTENHVDLGRVDRETAEAEIAKSQLRLQLELGEQIVLFSYPFGRRDQMSETARSFVKKSGFRCCLSAFGGLVEHDCDPYHIPRVPIPPYYRSPYQFGFEVVRSK
jgi:peptidoglycan/xylan/chitin deacetylase (PgdA/CDA1 family)